MPRTPGAKAVDDAAAVVLDGVGSESIKVKKLGRTRRADNAAFGVWFPKFPHPKANQQLSVVATVGTPNNPTRRKKQHNHILTFIHGILRSSQVAHTREFRFFDCDGSCITHLTVCPPR